MLLNLKYFFVIIILLSGSTLYSQTQTTTADLNSDGTVNIIDFAIFSSRWLADCSCVGKACGDDGCGGSCGTCGENEVCEENICVSDCDYIGYVVANEQATEIGNGDIFYNAQTSLTTPFDVISLEVYGSQGGPTTPTQIFFTGQNYNDCVVCLLAYKDCIGSGQCDKVFLAESGSVDITAIGSAGASLTGVFQDIVLIEVTIDNITFESTPVPNGEKWCINGNTFDVIIDSP